MQILKIYLENFKKFSRFELQCEKHNILTGLNNAGKSTALDALRIVSDVLKFAKRRRPEHVKFQGDLCASYELQHSLISISLTNIVRNYSDEPASVKVVLEDGSELVILLHDSHAIKVYLKSHFPPPKTGINFIKQFPLSLVVVPTLGPVEENEHYLTDATISKSENTRTAHRHLRNILIRKSDEDFQTFAKEVSIAWPNIQLEKPKIGLPGQPIYMDLFEKGIPREIFWSGFGLQVWMLMMLQFMRGSPQTTLILDEPDIYLHPQLQVTLLEMAKQRFGQVFVATHSLALIREAKNGELVEISDETEVAKRI